MPRKTRFTSLALGGTAKKTVSATEARVHFGELLRTVAEEVATLCGRTEREAPGSCDLSRRARAPAVVRALGGIIGAAEALSENLSLGIGLWTAVARLHRAAASELLWVRVIE